MNINGIENFAQNIRENMPMGKKKNRSLPGKIVHGAGKVAMAPVKVAIAPFKYIKDHPLRSLAIALGLGASYGTYMVLNIRQKIIDETR